MAITTESIDIILSLISIKTITGTKKYKVLIMASKTNNISISISVGFQNFSKKPFVGLCKTQQALKCKII